MRSSSTVFLVAFRTRPTKGGSIAVALGTLAVWREMMPLRGSFVVNALLFGPPLTRSRRGSGFRGVLPLIRETISSSASFTPRREFVVS